MAYELALTDSVKDSLRKLVKKDSETYRRLMKIFNQLTENPYGVGKWMHSEYAFVREKRVGHFVLKYVIDETKKQVTIVDYSHHA